ncbi:hypothetical protein GRI38_13305 [Altererythrobacter aurantiacus]|uniref:Nucleotide modification associated domain-containing protein n=1 Tax=Parapontixanthobacter aurantiacus TaxID=1463599 RepID=A0A844ZGM7_9SPHN|nr:hypothetical protein [Parapontixanthobacter aurantiacus]MXO87005.1 hypothetical protein [Parapontixanthobacter aurantiacus]
MRIVFSRKGFDSAAGGGPSPIIDGRPVSLPIPDSKGLSRATYGDCGLGELVATASRGRLSASDLCHHDPMFLPGDRCVFGQCGGAQTHLDRNGVTIGDVFLFFGWFRSEEEGDHHRIFGYLRIEEIVRLADCGEAKRQEFAELGHPHAFGFHHPNRSDTLYAGTGVAASEASGRLRLSREGMTRTHWRVPEWLGKVGLSYHRGANRWPAPDHLVSVAQGQEFVADIGTEAEPREWLDGIIRAIRKS